MELGSKGTLGLARLLVLAGIYRRTFDIFLLCSTFYVLFITCRGVCCRGVWLQCGCLTLSGRDVMQEFS